eukprot:SM000407S15249  [mRNA]  locus=s407:26692:27340:+ [translate_table: standard]
MSRRRGEPADFNAAGLWAQVYRMRLSVSLQRSMAHALHLRAGRALAAASGFRQGDSFPAARTMPSFNAAGSLAQVFRMRLAVSLQRSLAYAVHTRAGRAMAAASGSRRNASFHAASYSDLMLLTRGY